MCGSQNNGNTVDLCKALGLPLYATPNEIDAAYQEKMRAYRRQQHTQPADVMNQNKYYHTKKVVSTLKDGVFKRQVKENVNGEVKEYEEEYTDVPHMIGAHPPAKRKHIRWEF